MGRYEWLFTPVFYVLLDQWTTWLRRIGVRFAVEHRPQLTAQSAPQPALETAHSA